jgi:CO/xanthine dehydrogenase FAD-binding subunit
VTEAYSPASLEAALQLLADRPGVRPVAGCTDLMVGEPEARAALPEVMDLLRIPELRGIRPVVDGLEIGATTTFGEIRQSGEIAAHCPILGEAARQIGGWQIQSRATLGGNVANASPAGDSLPALLALEAVAIAVGPGGRREVPYRDWHTGYRQIALEPGELLGWIRVPKPPAGSRQFFRKVGTREAQAISKVVVAAVGHSEGGVIARLRLAAGSVAATPILLTAVEEGVVGLPVGEETAALAGRLAAEAVEPIDDVRSTAAYRRWVLERVVRRMVLNLSESAADGVAA